MHAFNLWIRLETFKGKKFTNHGFSKCLKESGLLIITTAEQISNRPGAISFEKTVESRYKAPSM